MSERAPVAPVPGGTTSRYKTGSRTELVGSIRRLLLDYAEPNGVSARQYLEERLFNGRSRDTQVVFPYAVMRLDTDNAGTNNGMRLNGSLEVLVFGRPWSQLERVDAIADLFDRCMVACHLNFDGLVFANGFQRNLLPGAVGSAIDAEVCTVRLVYTLAIWPTYLTNLTLTLP